MDHAQPVLDQEPPMINTLNELVAWLRLNKWPAELVLHPDDFWNICNRLQSSHRIVPIQLGPTKIWPKVTGTLDVSDHRIMIDQ